MAACPRRCLENPVDYESLAAVGSIIGSGGMVVMDKDTCMVDIARYFLDFTQKESCGECVPCRLGTRQMLDILKDITSGKGKPGDIELLTELGSAVKRGSLCALGQTAPNPVLTTIRYFRDEYEAHINEKRCPALVCKALIRYQIVAEKCRACGLCAKACPADAITGAKKTPYVIDQSKCVKCGVCLETCPAKFGAVECVSGPMAGGVGVMDEVTLKIDGLDVKAAPGTTILEAALANGVYIPHLCYHPDLRTVGVCRLCMVEIQGRGLTISCKAPVEQGMVVKTDSPDISSIRRVAVELLIINHHADCLSCPKDADCQLQEVARFIGISEERLEQTPEAGSRFAFGYVESVLRPRPEQVRAVRNLRPHL